MRYFTVDKVKNGWILTVDGSPEIYTNPYGLHLRIMDLLGLGGEAKEENEVVSTSSVPDDDEIPF